LLSGGEGLLLVLEGLRLPFQGLFALFQPSLKTRKLGPLLADLALRFPLDAERLVLGLNDNLPLLRLGLFAGLLDDPSGGLFGRSNPRLGDVPAQQISQEEPRKPRQSDVEDRGRCDGGSPPLGLSVAYVARAFSPRRRWSSAPAVQPIVAPMKKQCQSRPRSLPK
jgi:hypothetical protein